MGRAPFAPLEGRHGGLPLPDPRADLGHAGGVLAGVGVADGALKVDQDLHPLRRARQVALLLVQVPQVPASERLSLAVAGLAGDGQRLLVGADGAAGVAQGGVGQTEVAQVGAFAAAVADLAGDGQRLLVGADGAAGVAQVGVGQTQVGEPGPSSRRSPSARPAATARSKWGMASAARPRSR